MIKLVTHSTQNYLGRIMPYLESLNRYSPFENWLLTVDCPPPVNIDRLPKIHGLRVPKVAGAPDYSWSLQHGAFVDLVPGDESDLMIYTDGDILMQREPYLDEIAIIESVGDGVSAGWNSGPDETLWVEAQRLSPRVSREQLVKRMGEIAVTAPCYNIGVFVGRRSTFRRIHDEYMRWWEIAVEAFAHPARQQWLVNYVIARLGIPVKRMEYSLHANGHYGVPPGVEYRQDGLYFGERLVLFRHKL